MSCSIHCMMILVMARTIYSKATAGFQLVKQTRNPGTRRATWWQWPSAIRDSLRLLRRPIQMCKSLGVRHGFAEVMAPALKL